MSSDESTEGRRERKRRSTRQALATAALDLFEEKGFAATTIEDITERADVARRTFFRHFSGKDAVLFPDPAEYEERLIAALDRQPPPLTMGRLLDAFTDAAGAMEIDQVHQRRRTTVIVDNQLHLVGPALSSFVNARDTVVGHLARREGLGEGDHRLDLAVSLGLFAIARAYVRWSGGEADGSLADELRVTVDLMRGLVTDEITFGPME